MPRNRTPRSRERRWLWAGIVAVLVLLLVGAAAWVGIRASLARDELQAAVPLAQQTRDQVIAGDASGATESIETLTEHASDAAALTGDPIYRVAEFVPVIGPNLSALRQVAQIIDEVAGVGLTRAASFAGSLDASSLTPIGGRVDLQPLIDATPAIKTAETIMDRALVDVNAIDTSGTITEVTDAVAQLTTVVEKASSALRIASRTAQLMPAMLGAEEPRNYLLMFQNNAEVRANGGIAGALAVVSTADGAISLTDQSSANALDGYPAAVLPVDEATTRLYGDATARLMQNVNATPDFPTTGRLAREIWRLEKGTTVDGVLAVDPVALSYLLRATGSVRLSSGDLLTPDNAVSFLLSGIYAKYPNNAQQDLLFQEAASRVFESLTTGKVDASELLGALAQSAEERRILIWNTRTAEERLLRGTDFAGALPTTNDNRSVIGVFLNDTTGAKLDYYLDAHTGVTRCVAGRAVGETDAAAGGDVTYRTEIVLSSSVPQDALTALPSYVRGNGDDGIPPGTMRTRVAVYGPVGSAVTSATVNGADVGAQVDEHQDRSVAQVTIDLPPGATQSIRIDMRGSAADSDRLEVQMTPLVKPAQIEVGTLDCG